MNTLLVHLPILNFQINQAARKPPDHPSAISIANTDRLSKLGWKFREFGLPQKLRST